MISTGVVKKFGELIKKAEQRIIDGVNEGRIETEPSITDRFLDQIETVFNTSESTNGISFKARTLRDRGSNAPEKEFGADFCGVMNIQLDGFELKKGFLSQAKRAIGGIKVNADVFPFTNVNFKQNSEFNRLVEQVDNMLDITPDSFVFVYDSKGIMVVPAMSINGLKIDAELYAKPVDRFFKEYLMCFVGDHRLRAYDDDSLDSLRKETNSRTAIMFEVQQKEDKITLEFT